MKRSAKKNHVGLICSFKWATPNTKNWFLCVVRFWPVQLVAHWIISFQLIFFMNYKSTAFHWYTLPDMFSRGVNSSLFSPPNTSGSFHLKSASNSKIKTGLLLTHRLNLLKYKFWAWNDWQNKICVFFVRLSSTPQARLRRLCQRIYANKKFPRDFIWGAASSAYQIEGAWNVDGKADRKSQKYTFQTPLIHTFR